MFSKEDLSRISEIIKNNEAIVIPDGDIGHYGALLFCTNIIQCFTLFVKLVTGIYYVYVISYSK
jgi:hypothetical protein